jgi:hypothetical protein
MLGWALRYAVGCNEGAGMEAFQPIFVVGRNRSGTKWLSNILANHASIAAVQHPEGNWSGMLSTNLLSQFPKVFGDLRNNENRSGFIACFAVAPEGAQPHASLPPQPVPEGKFVVIRRTNVLDNTRSSLALHQQGEVKPASSRRIAGELASYFLHRAIEQHYLRGQSFLLVEYEQLKSDTDRTVRPICDFLGLDYDPSMLKVPYAPNTSFLGRKKREDVVSGLGLVTFKLLRPIAQRIPGQVLWWLFNMCERLTQPRYSAPRFIRGTFRSFRAEMSQVDTGMTPVAPREVSVRQVRGEA